MDGKCEALFTQGPCSPGKILVPEQFSLNDTENENCPDGFSCRLSTCCKSYGLAKKDMEELSGSSRERMKNHVKSLVCNKKERQICCPKDNQKSILSAEIIMKSLKPSGKTKCIRNPCAFSDWSRVDEDGKLKFE